MTNILIQLFIKDHENVKSVQVRTSYGILTSIVGIACNLTLFIMKLAIGLLLNSVAVIADAFNNLSDAASSVISFVGVKMAAKPADKEHPFGHGRMEYIAAFIIAFLVIQVGFSFLKDSIDKIRNPEILGFQVVSVIFLTLSIFVKIWLGVFNKTLGKKIDSSVMQATSTDAFGDAVITTVTVLSIIIGKFMGWTIDGFVGVLVSGFIIWAGIGILKDTVEPLLGEAVPEEVYRIIVEKIESYEGIEGTHDLIVHNYGPQRNMATVHAEVSKDVDVLESHELIDRIEKEVFETLHIFLVIHMDPIETNDKKILKIKNNVIGIVEGINSKYSIHDFRYVDGENHVNLIFDLVVPRNIQNLNEDNIKNEVQKRVKMLDQRFECVITVERSFIYEES